MYRTPVFIAVVFTVAKTGRQHKRPWTEEWKKKMWYIYTMEYYSAIKKNKIMPFAATQMQLEIIIPREVSQKKTNITCYHLNGDSKKVNLPEKQKQTHRPREHTCGCRGKEQGEGCIGSLGLADANCYQGGPMTRSYCTAQGTVSNLLG